MHVFFNGKDRIDILIKYDCLVKENIFDEVELSGDPIISLA